MTFKGRLKCLKSVIKLQFYTDEDSAEIQ